MSQKGVMHARTCSDVTVTATQQSKRVRKCGEQCQNHAHGERLLRRMKYFSLALCGVSAVWVRVVVCGCQKIMEQCQILESVRLLQHPI